MSGSGAEYRLYAAECVELAYRVSDAPDRALLVKMAQAFFELAHKLDRLEAPSNAAAHNERECPYIVEIAVPPIGLGATLIAILDFHRDRKRDLRRGRSRRRDGQDYVLWCFASIADATEFQKAFGGKLIFSLS